MRGDLACWKDFDDNLTAPSIPSLGDAKIIEIATEERS